mgnify:FL=1
MATGEIARYGVSIQCFERLQVPNGSLMAWYMGVLVSENLNRGLEAMMANPSLQWAWIMGDDHTYDAKVVMNLLAREKDVVLPLCLNRVPPMDPSIMLIGEARCKYLEEMPTSGLYQLATNETMGDAGMLVRRSVLEKLSRPFYDRLRSGSFKSEDQAFINKIREAGVDVYVDMDNTIGHIASVDVHPVVVGGKWRVRLTGSLKKLVDIEPQRVASVGV